MSEPRLYRDAREDMLRSHLALLLAELNRDHPRLAELRSIAEDALRVDYHLAQRMASEGCLLAPSDPARRWL